MLHHGNLLPERMEWDHVGVNILMIGQSEMVRILKEFEENNGLLIAYKAHQQAKGDWETKERTIRYLTDSGFIEPIQHMDHKYFSITKKGIRFLEKEDIMEDENVNKKGKTVKREKKLLKYLEENGPSLKRELARKIKTTEDVAYQVLRAMAEDGKIIMTKQNGKNVYSLPNPEETPQESPVDVPQEVPLTDPYSDLKEKASSLAESRDKIVSQPGAVKVEEIEPTPTETEGQLNEETIISCLLPGAEKIIIEPKKLVTAIFPGQKQILQGHDALPVEVREATEITIMPGETYQMDIKVGA
jgi:predicted transcriptional regulator